MKKKQFKIYLGSIYPRKTTLENMINLTYNHQSRVEYQQHFSVHSPAQSDSPHTFLA